MQAGYDENHCLSTRMPYLCLFSRLNSASNVPVSFSSRYRLGSALVLKKRFQMHLMMNIGRVLLLPPAEGK